MTLTLELEPEFEARLKSQAAAQGKPIADYVRDLIARDLPPMQARPKRTLQGYGMFANSPRSVEAFERESWEEKAREEREFAGPQP